MCLHSIIGEYSAPDHFTSVKNNHALMKAVPHSDLHVEKKHLIRGLYPGTCLDIYYPGFPTMNYIPHTVSKLSFHQIFKTDFDYF